MNSTKAFPTLRNLKKNNVLTSFLRYPFSRAGDLSSAYFIKKCYLCTMILSQFNLIFRLKWVIGKRTVREIPFPYLILLSIFALSAGWLLLKADFPVTWKSLSVAAMLQLLICTRLKYPANKKELLSQYPKLYYASSLTDTLLTTLPFLGVHAYFWLIAVAVAALYVVFTVRKNEGIQVKQLTIPSPLFPKSAYLWHSQFRVFLPAAWLLMVAIIIMARVHDNFNLAMVVYCGGIFISLVAIILQEEKPDFIHIYLNSKHFIRKTTEETLASTTIFALPPAVLLLLLFPSEWPVIALSFLCILLVGINLLWIKYIFYPSMILASLFFFVGLAIQAAFAISLYGLILIPLYYLGLYCFFKKRANHYFTENERIDY